MGTLKNVLAYTNPVVWPVAISALGACIIAALFGGVVENVKTVAKNSEL